METPNSNRYVTVSHTGSFRIDKRELTHANVSKASANPLECQNKFANSIRTKLGALVGSMVYEYGLSANDNCGESSY